MKYTKSYENLARQLARLNGEPFAIYLLGSLDGARGCAAWQRVRRRKRKELSLAQGEAEQAVLQSLVKTGNEGKE